MSLIFRRHTKEITHIISAVRYVRLYSNVDEITLSIATSFLMYVHDCVQTKSYDRIKFN